MRQLKTLSSLFDRAAFFRRISAIRPCAGAVLAAALAISGSALLPTTALATSILATTIDDFTESTMMGLNEIAPTMIPPSQFEMGLASVAGGDRTMELVVTMASGIANNVAADIETSGNGQAVYASGPMADGALSLLYDGTNLAADLGVVDIINVSFNAFDNGFNQEMDVTVFISEGANTADVTHTLTDSFMASMELPFDFSGFAAVDRANLTSIEIHFEAMQGQDFAIGSIYAAPVPEPATVTLLCLGALMAIGAYRVRRRS